ncbi:unnamed protein product [Discosporangium mesarthrocarpum]
MFRKQVVKRVGASQQRMEVRNPEDHNRHYPARAVERTQYTLSQVDVTSPAPEDTGPNEDSCGAQASLVINPTLEYEELNARLTVDISNFTFQCNMIKTGNIEGSFVYEANLTLKPTWDKPQAVSKVEPDSAAETSSFTDGRGLGARIGFSPSVSIQVNQGCTRSVPQWSLARMPVVAQDDQSKVSWQWKMNRWGDNQEFDSRSTDCFRMTSSMPRLPYHVVDGKAILYLSDMKASWPIRENLINEKFLGSLPIDVTVELHLMKLIKPRFRVPFTLQREGEMSSTSCVTMTATIKV